MEEYYYKVLASPSTAKQSGIACNSFVFQMSLAIGWCWLPLLAALAPLADASHYRSTTMWWRYLGFPDGRVRDSGPLSLQTSDAASEMSFRHGSCKG